MVALIGSTVAVLDSLLSILHVFLIVFLFVFLAFLLFFLFLLLVGEVGFDSLAKLAGRPRMRVPPYLGGF